MLQPGSPPSGPRCRHARPQRSRRSRPDRDLQGAGTSAPHQESWSPCDPEADDRGPQLLEVVCPPVVNLERVRDSGRVRPAMVLIPDKPPEERRACRHLDRKAEYVLIDFALADAVRLLPGAVGVPAGKPVANPGHPQRGERCDRRRPQGRNGYQPGIIHAGSLGCDRTQGGQIDRSCHWVPAHGLGRSGMVGKRVESVEIRPASGWGFGLPACCLGNRTRPSCGICPGVAVISIPGHGGAIRSPLFATIRQDRGRNWGQCLCPSGMVRLRSLRAASSAGGLLTVGHASFVAESQLGRLVGWLRPADVWLTPLRLASHCPFARTSAGDYALSTLWGSSASVGGDRPKGNPSAGSRLLAGSGN